MAASRAASRRASPGSQWVKAIECCRAGKGRAFHPPSLSINALRRSTPALQIGEYIPLRSRHDLQAFERRAAGRWLIGLNIADEPRLVEFPGEARLVLSSYLHRPENQSHCGFLQLRASEGVILELDKDKMPEQNGRSQQADGNCDPIQKIATLPIGSDRLLTLAPGSSTCVECLPVIMHVDL
jgi:hypothetical protein